MLSLLPVWNLQEFGIGAADLKTNDRVCIFPGSTVPLVLRKDGVFWEFVQDAYVHGIMDVSTSNTEPLAWLHIC